MRKKNKCVDSDLKFEITIAIVTIIILIISCILLGVFIYSSTKDILWSILTPILCILVGFIINIILKIVEIFIIKLIKRE